MSPQISIGMPVFNCERTLGHAIRSIQHQTYPDWELLIIDDGSNDRTVEIANGFRDSRLRVFERDSNLGLPQRLNECIGLARGQYFARMDGDDVSYPNRLSQQLRFLERNPDVDLVGGSISIFSGAGRLRGWRPARLSHDQICGTPISRMGLAHVTWLGRRRWFLENPYHPERTAAQDRDLLIRTHRRSRFAAIPDVVVGVREEKFSVKKQFNGRSQLTTSLLADGLANSDWRSIAAAAFEVAKFGLDLFAITSGLGYRVLRHRARPLDPTLVEDWVNTWSSVRA
jgi:glycosyltransferase involved in cell wall biosynthesis